MLRSYLSIAWRSMIRNGFFSLINITGLALGLSFTLLVAAFVWKELSVNGDLDHIDDQYIIHSKWKDPNMGPGFTTLGPLAKTLGEEYPHLVANYYRFDAISSNVKLGEKVFREGIQLGDSTLLSMYGFPLIEGNLQHAFAAPYSVVITKELALKYFNQMNVVGEVLSIENFSGERHDFTITGVMDKSKRNSVTYINEYNDNQLFIANTDAGFFNRNMEVWTNNIIIGFIQLQKGIKPEDLKEPIQNLLATHTPNRIQDNLEPYCIPLKNYHLDAQNGAIRRLLFTISGVAMFILLMALVNFINISISQANKRMKEIGVRKILGGMRRSLIFQFYTESLLLVALAFIISIVIYLVVHPFFGSIVGKSLPIIADFSWHFILFLVGLILLVALLSGTYPAIFLSSFRPVHTIKGKMNELSQPIRLRKGLVSFQYLIAAFVLMSALTISQQIKFLFNSDLGYDKEYLVTAQLPRNWSTEGVRKMASIREQFTQLKEVENVTLSYQIPDGYNAGQTRIYPIGGDSSLAVSTELMFSDEYYASTFDIPLLAGTCFHEPNSYRDSLGIVINLKQAKALGWEDPHEAINQKVQMVDNPTNFVIKGIVDDYHYGSMHQAITPLTMLHVQTANLYRYFTFKVRPGKIAASIVSLKETWKRLMPNAPFDYAFMDDKLDQMYQVELQLQKASYLASLLVMIIALLGVIGLIAITIQQKAKEVSIRKIVGASAWDILWFFMKRFLPISILASMIAIPFTWWVMQQWLNNYQYHIELGPLPFLFTIVILSLLTFLVLSLQSLRILFTNPIHELKED